METQLLPHHSIKDKQVQHYTKQRCCLETQDCKRLVSFVLCSHLVSFSEIFGACTVDAATGAPVCCWCCRKCIWWRCRCCCRCWSALVAVMVEPVPLMFPFDIPFRRSFATRKPLQILLSVEPKMNGAQKSKTLFLAFGALCTAGTF